MYSRQHRTAQTSAKSSDTPVSNQFAPRGFVVQPQAEEVTQQQTPDLQTESAKERQFSSDFLDISVSPRNITPPLQPRIQMKLTIGQPGDKYEQEADRVAKDVVQQINAPESQNIQRQQRPENKELQIKPLFGKIQRVEMPEEGELRMKPIVQRLSIHDGMAATPDLEASIQRVRGNGQPLAQSARKPMEQAFGANFSGVKIHTDSQSDRLNQSIQAKAFTTGQDMFFSQGAYNPGSRGGQELIAHELTHVVQQNGSTVQRAIQTQDKSAITPTTTNIQRKIAFAGLNTNDKLLYTKFKEALDKHKQLLSEQDSQTINEAITEKNLFLEKIRYMELSPEDYGEINLDNPQHLLFFIKDYIKFDLNGKTKIEEEPHKQKEVWKEQKEKLPEPSRYFKTALLGTGPSIANYLNVHGRSLDPEETVIIGKIQPWDSSSPESRGIDFINHPMHMTSPVRHQTNLPKESSGSDETFKGNPAKLTADINTVMGRFNKPVNTTIKKVSRDENKWYKIETDQDDYYALKVISGLGIGPHKFDNLNALSKEITTEEHKETEKKRVMDLDTFQRQLKDPQSVIMKEYKEYQDKGHTLIIGVAGPNAGVDATCEATELGMVVEWVVTGGPAIAEGMGNKINRKGLVNLFFDYLKGWTISAAGFVKMQISGKWKAAEQRKQAGDNFLKNNPGWDVSEEQEVLVDYLVIAQGPDVAKVWGIFDESATKDLTLKDDKQGRFGAPDSEDFWQGSIETSLRSSKYNIYWEGIYERVKTILGTDKVFTWQKTRDILLQEAMKILEVEEFANITLQENVAIGLGTEDDSLEIIGGSAIRILNYLDSQKDRNKVPEKLRNAKVEEKMKKVTETLSSPTILNNDQLTPIRSQVEAEGDYMPGYIGTEESNFVTDDQTMIAAQIASYYGNIPAALANWVTQKIIQDRHQKGVKPGTIQGSRAFVDSWKNKLEDLHKLFSRENIEAVSSKNSI
ncbi:DUF4157 domain-containing protein [Nostoc sp. CENA67]|uniref:DUF4157 domain-containing protein n=1 Tax=Amazonocrinis nigriterrae CENA67 TaxID=2794033 RepID=A0A8J7HK01_9NOST|nr:DUF4157 domain-containing protein [Amazonocrinis nigriterrae]MBH8560921.1 DUF4157 domain-containing protein [Amazonocrinis nigriterrae CENA67]